MEADRSQTDVWLQLFDALKLQFTEVSTSITSLADEEKMETIDSEGAETVNRELLLESFKQLIQPLNEFDLSEISSTMNLLKGLAVPEILAEEIGKLKGYVDSYRYEDASWTLSVIIEKLEN